MDVSHVGLAAGLLAETGLPMHTQAALSSCIRAKNAHELAALCKENSVNPTLAEKLVRLGLLPGAVRPIAPIIGAGLKVPHIGWNALSFPESKTKSPLFAQVDAGECVYFVHSYAAMECDAVVTATAEYGVQLTAAAGLANVMGTQFHPEKSGDVGLRILKAFSAL